MWVIVHDKQAMLVHANSSSIRVLMEFCKHVRICLLMSLLWCFWSKNNNHFHSLWNKYLQRCHRTINSADVPAACSQLHGRCLVLDMIFETVVFVVQSWWPEFTYTVHDTPLCQALIVWWQPHWQSDHTQILIYFGMVFTWINSHTLGFEGLKFWK